MGKWFLLPVLGALACARPTAFMCDGDHTCALAGAMGRCEPVGYCSFADDVCPSGWRYGTHAAAAIAEACVPSVDAAMPPETESSSAAEGSESGPGTSGGVEGTGSDPGGSGGGSSDEGDSSESGDVDAGSSGGPDDAPACIESGQPCDDAIGCCDGGCTQSVSCVVDSVAVCC